MALASQSTRSDRPVHSIRRSRTLLGTRGIVALCAAGAAFGGSYWLMRGDAEDAGIAPAPKSSGTLLASTESATLPSIPAQLTATPIAPTPEAVTAAAHTSANGPSPSAPGPVHLLHGRARVRQGRR